MDLSTFGSISHLWGFSTMGMMGWDDYGVHIWNICKDEGKLMGMAADGYYDQNIINMLKTVITYKDLKFTPYASNSHDQWLI
jgi:hypothetical protein